MNVELINTGSELMLGRVLNTHQLWLCRHLADLGYVVSRQVAIADSPQHIEHAVRESLARSDLLLVTGGLGPTSDDITLAVVARLLQRPLREHPGVLAHLQNFFEVRRRPMPPRTRVQALVPEGAVVLSNAFGTAPGLALLLNPNPFRPDLKPAWLVLLPGPPRELRPMFTDTVVPMIKRVMPPPEAFVCRTLRATGIGESVVEEKIAEPLGPLVNQGLELGYCARPWEVDVRLAARGIDASNRVSQAERIVLDRLGSYVYGVEDDNLESGLVRSLTERKQTLALAESCTGGWIANRLTNVPGASAVLLAGLVTYCNEAKTQFLGVSPETLARHGAVSEPTALEMAEGARRQTQASFALSVTGIAGPGGGSAEKPVGTVFIALAGPSGATVTRQFNSYDRETFKHVTSQQALDLLRRTLTQTSSPL
jgi:nicotinamide-nucleotide amidase